MSLEFPWGMLSQPLLQVLFPPTVPAAISTSIRTGSKVGDVATPVDAGREWQQGKSSSFSTREQKP